MQIDPYLNFNGQCKEAFEFYEQLLGGKIEAMMTHADMPNAEELSPEWRSAILHARLVVDGQVLMGSDRPPQKQGETKGKSWDANDMYVSLGIDDPAEAERVYHALAEGGKVEMPIQQTFWAPRFGMLVDRFGIPWMISGGQPEGSAG
ncbi:MAG TPA: VOC family protein [Rhodothermales bacterium]|nr:VOC family protein [Rhodothermales bacterium]